MAYTIDHDLCTACGSCEDACPNGAISHKGKIVTINPAKCTECSGKFDTQQCADVCPVGAPGPLAV